ncbi:hypothetical protein [Microvirga sp. 17 mud 1-3]|uniref:hypothetical protein n=1 Tax=Microvirga sp. 17 mud 1-3 TaxID=2082949 RepID=UPI000D6D2D17|nr:hypothetical protein [Microvirga sp. 17 mud 1-3]AWM87366.1 hypothetical protein C4E04_11900 [Microvirga sp. 17 mud 1-3]
MACPTTNRYLPATATAGLNFSASVSAPEYPAPDWALALYLRGPNPINLNSTPDGTAHTFAAAAAATAEWAAGDYWYSLRATNGTDTVELETGTIRVLPDLVAAGAGYDGRSQAQIALDAIEAVLAKRATIDQERYRINNRELYRTSISDLLKLRAFYAAQVKRENGIKSGRSTFGRQIAVRFTA